MEEQEIKNSQDSKEVKHECKCSLHPFWKYLFIGLAVFLGTFCAAYAMIDWHIKSFYSPFPEDVILRNERIMQREFQDADRMLNSDEQFIKNKMGIIHAEQKDGIYKIIISLKPFDNNPDNVNIKADKDTLNISAKSVDKSKNAEHIAHFQQSYVFGEDVNLSKMNKTVKDGNIILTIPSNKQENDD